MNDASKRNFSVNRDACNSDWHRVNSTIPNGTFFMMTLYLPAWPKTSLPAKQWTATTTKIEENSPEKRSMRNANTGIFTITNPIHLRSSFVDSARSRKAANKPCWYDGPFGRDPPVQQLPTKRNNFKQTILIAMIVLQTTRIPLTISLANDRSLYVGWLNILDTMRSWYGKRSFVVCVSHSPARTFKSFALAT